MTAHLTPATSGWGMLRELTGRHRGRMSLLALTSFAGAMIEAAFLVLLTASLLAVAGGADAVGPVRGHSISLVTSLALGAGAIAARFALSLVAVHAAATLGATVRSEQRIALARAYLFTSWEVQQGEPSGRLQELVTSFVGRLNLAVTAMTQGVAAALSLVAFLGVSLLIQPLASIAVLAILGLLSAVLGPLRRHIRARSAEANRSDLDFAAHIAAFGALPLEFQVFGVREAISARVSALTRVASENQRKVQVVTGRLSPTYTLFVYAAILLAVALLSRLGTADVASVGSVMLLMLRSMTFGQQLTSVSGTVSAAIPSLHLIDATVRTYAANAAGTGSAIPTSSTPITLSEVSYSYSPERPALREVSLVIEPGTATGVIGPSGAGKSSLAYLLLGLRGPGSGRVDIAGVDLHEVQRAWWCTRVSFVPQHPQLFTGTVAENLRFFRDEIRDEELVAAARAANIHDDIMALPQGYDSHLGERGSQLSGGQRQRLSIARALAGRPEVLILDEPTSALDPASEALIRASLEALRGQVTLVVIAHRMSTLDLCDRLLVMDGGRVTADGTPEQVRRTSEFYRRALHLAGA